MADQTKTTAADFPAGTPPDRLLSSVVSTLAEAAAEIERLRAHLQNIAALKRSMGYELCDAVGYAKRALCHD